jgi:hypothetical protein
METTSPRHHHAPTVVWPFLLIGVGLAALLVNAGAISWDSLGRIAGLWPLLLVLVGVELIISRAAPAVIALPANVAISALALIGALLLMVSGASWPISSWWPATPVQTMTRSAPMPQLDRAQLAVSYAAGDLRIHAGRIGGDLYQAHLTYAGNPAPSVWLDTASGTVHVERGSRGPFQVLPAGTHERVDLVLSDQIPWNLTVNAGASQQTLDLRGLSVTGVQVNAGATSLEIDLPKPQGTVSVRVNGGAMSIRMLVPGDAGVAISSSGAFNSLQADGQAISGLGRQNWQSANFAATADHYDISFSGGASSVRLERW